MRYAERRGVLGHSVRFVDTIRAASTGHYEIVDVAVLEKLHAEVHAVAQRVAERAVVVHPRTEDDRRAGATTVIRLAEAEDVTGSDKEQGEADATDRHKDPRRSRSSAHSSLATTRLERTRR